VKRIRFFFIACIVLQIAAISGEAKFNLDATTSTSIELAVSMFNIVVDALTLNYWDGEKMSKYWTSIQSDLQTDDVTVNV